MKIGVIGGSGLIGTKLVRLRQKGHEVVAASPNRPESASWARIIIREQIFRAARATVLRELRWDSIGARAFEAIRGMIQVNVDALDGASIGPDRP